MALGNNHAKRGVPALFPRQLKNKAVMFRRSHAKLHHRGQPREIRLPKRRQIALKAGNTRDHGNPSAPAFNSRYFPFAAAPVAPRGIHERRSLHEAAISRQYLCGWCMANFHNQFRRAYGVLSLHLRLAPTSSRIRNARSGCGTLFGSMRRVTSARMVSLGWQTQCPAQALPKAHILQVGATATVPVTNREIVPTLWASPLDQESFLPQYQPLNSTAQSNQTPTSRYSLTRSTIAGQQTSTEKSARYPNC